MKNNFYKLSTEFPTMAKAADLDAEGFRNVVIALIDHSLGRSNSELSGNEKRLFEAICETDDRQHREVYDDYSRRAQRGQKTIQEKLRIGMMKTAPHTGPADHEDHADPAGSADPDNGREKENEKGGEKEKSTKRERDSERVRERELVSGGDGNKLFENQKDFPGFTTVLVGRVHTISDPEAYIGRQEEAKIDHTPDVLADPVRMNPPSAEEVLAYCEARGWSVDVTDFLNYNHAKHWMIGNTPIRDWKVFLELWYKRAKERAEHTGYEAADSPYRTWKFFDELEY